MNNIPDIATQKQQLREKIKALKQTYSLEKLKNLSTQIYQRIESSENFSRAKTILFYYALPDEVRTEDLIEYWYKKKTLLLPVVHGEKLQLRKYDGPQSLKKNRWGISEPEGENFTEWKSIDLAIVPAMAYDREGHRLGRGKGFYDRLLNRLDCTTVGLCFPFQFFDKIPFAEWDQKIDHVIF